jgi:hypothetical protein
LSPIEGSWAAKREPRALVDLDALAQGICEDAADASGAVTYAGDRGVTVSRIMEKATQRWLTGSTNLKIGRPSGRSFSGAGRSANGQNGERGDRKCRQSRERWQTVLVALTVFFAS